MKSAITKRSIVVGGHKTSISLEDIFWNALKDLATEKNIPLSEMVDSIDKTRDGINLSSSLRQHIMQHYYDAATRKPLNAPAEAQPVQEMHRSN